MIKLIALDIDGTIFSSNYEILESTIKGLKHCHDQGIEIVLASGRSLLEMEEIINILPFIDYAVCGNGSSVYHVDSRKKLHEIGFDYKYILDIYDKIKHIPHMLEYYDDLHVYAEDQNLNILKEFGLERFHEYLLKTRTIVDDVIAYMRQNQREIEKVNINFKSSFDQKRALKIVNDLNLEMNITSSFHHNIEISHVEAHKARGLLFLKDYLQIDLSEMMAFGDGLNDKEMIETVGYGIAMGNAQDKVKEAANYVTTSNNDDGIYNAIKKYGLID